MVVLRQLERSRRDLGFTAADDCVFSAGEAEVVQGVDCDGAQFRVGRRDVISGGVRDASFEAAFAPRQSRISSSSTSNTSDAPGGITRPAPSAP